MPPLASLPSALITGAASGIGLAIARRCAGYGMALLLVDREAHKLEEAKKALSSQAKSVSTFAMDVANVSQWADLKQEADKVFAGPPAALFLNAGTTAKGTWGDADYFTKILNTNLNGVLHGLNTFVPSMRDAGAPAAIVLTGSKQGITNPPGNPAYNASKAAVRTLAEHLSWDLKDTPVAVHLLVPGWTFTGMTGGGTVTEKPAGAWAPEQVVEYMERKMEVGTFYIVCPDNDVDEATDKKRVLWTAGDVVYERPPLSRWREGYQEEFAEFVRKTNV